MHLPIELDRNRPEPLQNQLYEHLRALIISQRLKANSRLIATRFLAEQLGISRTTVLLAYERLISEGYLETRPAVGTFVCSVLPDQAPPAPNVSIGVEYLPQTELRPPVFQGPMLSPPPPRCGIDFWGGPDYRIFPFKVWQRITNNVLEYFGKCVSEGPPPAGIEQLRVAISDWLASHRGIVANPNQIIVVAGRQQAYNIAAHLFLRSGDRVVVECPCADGPLALFEGIGAVPHRVPVDEYGIEVEGLPSGPAALAYVTPSHQSPIGGTLPLERREQLIAWARSAGAFIIEDDCNGDFRYRGMGPPPLKSLDPYGLVLFTGSFSQSLGAGLRLGYLVVPPELAEAATTVKSMLDHGNPWLEQAILAEFISSGEYDRHLRRVRKTYLDRRDCLIAELQRHFGSVTLVGTDAGTQLTWLLPSEFPTAPTIQDLARRRDIGVYTVENPAVTGRPASRYVDKALVLGYSSLEERQIREGVAALAGALDEHGRKAG